MDLVARVKHRGFFDFQDIVKTIQTFLKQRMYLAYDWPAYKYKIPSPGGAEYEIIVEGSKKVTEYVKFKLEIFLRVFDMREVEIVRDGEKIKTNEGKVHIEIFADKALDWQKRFEGKGKWGKFLEWLKDVYEKYIIRYKISDYYDDLLYMDALDLKNELQSVLGQEVA